MQFDSSTPRNEITIQELPFTVPAPFKAGHQVNENEAAALNQILAENVRNNFAAKIKASKEKNEAPPSQSDLDAYVSEYEFGVRRGGTADPVMKEALALAKTAISAKLKAAGKSVTAADLTALAEEAVDKHPQLLEKAAAIVASRKETAASLGL